MNTPFTNSSTRRHLLTGAIGCAVSALAPAWAQTPKSIPDGKPLVIGQIIDLSPHTMDVSRDFLIGSRAAWSDINRTGGIRGRLVQHVVAEVSDSAAPLRRALAEFQQNPNCIALTGSAGHRAAKETSDWMHQAHDPVAHVAPWLQSTLAPEDRATFAIFATRQQQIAHAITSLSGIGIADIGVIFGSPQEELAHRDDITQISLRLKLKQHPFTALDDASELAKRLPMNTPRTLLFIGGTPELGQFVKGLGLQSRQFYVVALADVNMQTLMQMGHVRQASVIATQVVPMVNAPLLIVTSYRDAMARYFDEAPTPQSLAGFIAARFTAQVLSRTEGPLTRKSAVQAFQQRASVDLGGFQINAPDSRLSRAYVTQSMLTPDGRLIG